MEAKAQHKEEERRENIGFLDTSGDFFRIGAFTVKIRHTSHRSVADALFEGCVSEW